MKMVFLILAVVLFSGCKSAPKRADVAKSCVAFQWESHPQLGEKAAINVPITLNGKDFVFQSDTGSDVSYIYNKDLLGSNLEVKSEGKFEYVEVPVTFAQMDLGKRKIYLMNNMGDGSKPPQGTIGTDLLRDKTFLVNFSTTQMCMFENGTVPEEFTADTTLVPAKIELGKMILAVSAKHGDLNLFYDTGSSALPVFTDLPQWTKTVNKKSKQKVVKALSWGKEVPFIGKSPQAPLMLANTSLNVKQVYYRKDKSDLFKSWGRPGIDGSLGNEAFWTREWVYMIFDNEKPQFGLGPEKE